MRPQARRLGFVVRCEAVNPVYVAEMCSHAASATFTRKSRLGIDANRYYVKTVTRGCENQLRSL